MLQRSSAVNLANAIAPLYISIALGYGSSKLGILNHEQHYAGIVTFCFKFATPALVFNMLATNDPYSMNWRLVGADTLCKSTVLFALVIGCCYRPSYKHIARMNTLFNLATMPNSVLVGIPLLSAFYPDMVKNVNALVFMQCSLWFSVCILILEVYKAVYENSMTFVGNGNIQREEGISVSIAGGVSDADVESEHAKEVSTTVHKEINPAPPKLSSIVNTAVGTTLSGHEGGEEEVKMKESAISRGAMKRIVWTVASKFVWSAVVWASILGFTYSLINFKFNAGKPLPTILKTSVTLLANCTLGMAMFLLGMHMAASPKLIVGGLPQAVGGALVRFVVSPAIMAVASVVVGLRGEMLRFAILQAMIPQAISSFIFASQYNVNVDIFGTALWFQMLTFLPFAIALYSLLNAIT